MMRMFCALLQLSQVRIPVRKATYLASALVGAPRKKHNQERLCNVVIF